MGDDEAATGDGALLSVRPSWWNFAWYFVFFFVVLPGIVVAALYVLPNVLGIELPFAVPPILLAAVLALFYVVPPVVAHLKRLALELRVYGDRLVLERGILSRETKELFVEDVRSIDTHQSVTQRIVGTGDLMIASSGTDQYEYVVAGIPDPEQVKQLIVEQRQDVR